MKPIDTIVHLEMLARQPYESEQERARIVGEAILPKLTELHRDIVVMQQENSMLQQAMARRVAENAYQTSPDVREGSNRIVRPRE